MTKRAIGFFGIFGLSGALAACAGDIQTSPSATAFDRELQSGYAQLSEAEYNETDLVDGRAFARRERLSAAGTPPEPEAIGARELSEPYLSELTEARARLQKALQNGAAQAAPTDAARAQVGFDCWMQEAEEGFQPDDIAQCRNMFMTSMSALAAQMDERPQRQAEATPAPRTPEPQQPLRYVVFFPLDQAAVTSNAETALDSLVQDLKDSGASAVTLSVSGHADRSGSTSYNQSLSQRRVESVVAELQKKGVDASITERAFGESRPIVPTGDGVPEPRNRRVEIEIER